MASTFSEASFSGKMLTDFGWPCFSFLPEMFGLLPRQWQGNVMPTFSHDTHPTTSGQNCVEAHQDVLSSSGNKLYAQSSLGCNHQIPFWKTFLRSLEQRECEKILQNS
jgi:hypothetical protein